MHKIYTSIHVPLSLSLFLSLFPLPFRTSFYQFYVVSCDSFGLLFSARSSPSFFFTSFSSLLALVLTLFVVLLFVRLFSLLPFAFETICASVSSLGSTPARFLRETDRNGS